VTHSSSTKEPLGFTRVVTIVDVEDGLGPLSALWLMGLMSPPPVRKERVLLPVERGGDPLAQFSRFCQEVIKPPENAANGVKGGVRRILRRHATNSCNWYSTITA
jgi:hypothetical protein